MRLSGFHTNVELLDGSTCWPAVHVTNHGLLQKLDRVAGIRQIRIIQQTHQSDVYAGKTVKNMYHETITKVDALHPEFCFYQMGKVTGFPN